MNRITHKNIEEEFIRSGNPQKTKQLQRFFKTGKGEYAEGDLFLGITVPVTRNIVRGYRNLPLSELNQLIANKYHEIRLAALLILVYQFHKGDKKTREAIYEYYMIHTKYINNWDLVDLTAPHIVGGYLIDKDKDLLLKMVKSHNLWERRIAVLATFYFIKEKDTDTSFKLAKLLLDDPHDLIHKAVGWMLREIGKRVSREKEEKFLRLYAKDMPRTMLRYAIEHFPEEKRQKYLKMK